MVLDPNDNRSRILPRKEWPGVEVNMRPEVFVSVHSTMDIDCTDGGYIIYGLRRSDEFLFPV